jgi:hypothetical protein
VSDQASSGIVPFEYKGETYAIPAALIEAQRRWNAAHAACGRLQRSDDTEAYDAAYAARLDATRAKADDVWLNESGTFSHTRDAALRAAAAD